MRNTLALVVLIAASAVGRTDTPVVQYTTAPIPRVDIGGHSESVQSAAASPDGTLLVTVSVDKTARIWRTQSGELARVVRLPIDSGETSGRNFEGDLYGTAWSPDGRWVVIGGYLRRSYQGDRAFFVMAVDLTAKDSNDFPVLRYGGIPGLPSAALRLAFSPDGHYLAACLDGADGMVLYDWGAVLSGHSRWILEDRLKDDDQCNGLDFSVTGDLAVTTTRGHLRLFRRALQYQKPIDLDLSPLRRPTLPRFSPDGQSLALGSDLDGRFGIVQAQPPYRVTLRDLPGSDMAHSVGVAEWSGDGTTIWLGGEQNGSTNGLLYRVTGQGLGNISRTLSSEHAITDIRRLPGGAVAYTGDEPEVGVLEGSGKVRWRKRSNIVSVSAQRDDLRISPDGTEVALHPSAASSVWLTFSALRPAFSALRVVSTPPVDLRQPIRESAAWKFQISDDREVTQINNQKADTEWRERVIDHTVARDGRSAFLGTSWYLRRIDQTGKSLWRTPVSSQVQALAPSDDNHLLVAVLADGTVHWLRTDDGVEVLAALIMRNGVDWVAWIPPGYYMSSPAGDNLLGWHVNVPLGNGVYDVNFYRAVQFDHVFYRPDVVNAYLTERGSGNLQQWTKGTSGYDIRQLAAIAPPQLSISAGLSDASVKVKIRGRRVGATPQGWNLYVNGVPVISGSEQGLTQKELATGEFERSVSVSPTSPQTLLRAESDAGTSLGLAELNIDSPEHTAPPKGTLFLVAAGAGDFADPHISRLRFASKDADDFANEISKAGQSSYRAIRLLELTDSTTRHATRSAMADIAGFIAQAGANDTVLVFLASHGLSSPQGDYYFVPKDARRSDIDAVIHGAVTDVPSLVSWRELFAALQHSAGHRILIVDTCSSAAIAGTFDAHALAKHSLSSSFALLAASRGDEESQEWDKGGHGLFTYALLEAIRTGYDPNMDGVLSLKEAFDYAFDKVQDLHNRAVGSQTPQFVAPDALRDWPLVRVAAATGIPAQ